MKKKVHLSDVTEGFLYTVTTAEAFILGHKSTTFNLALQAVDIPATIKQQEAALSVDCMIKYPDDFDVATHRLGLLASRVWIFSYCVPMLFENEQYPPETTFWKVMEQFGLLVIQVEEGCATLITQSINFYNFAAECMRVIRILQMKIEFEGETTIQEPLQRGSGLQLNRMKSSQVSTKKKVDVKVAKVNKTDRSQSEWTKFADLPSLDKLVALKYLVNSTIEAYSLAQLQIRFLVDDIIESSLDVHNEQDVLFALGDMFDRISFMDSQPQTVHQEHEMTVIRQSMTQFTASLLAFIQAPQHIMEKVMELRDICQVSCEYLYKECGLDLFKVIPDVLFKNWGKRQRSCCCGLRADRNREFFMPAYQGQDLFRTYFEDATKVPFIPADNHLFQLTYVQDIFKHN
jgi:hypothetical protein